MRTPSSHSDTDPAGRFTNRSRLDSILEGFPPEERMGLEEAWNLVGDAPPVDPSVQAASWAALQKQLFTARAPMFPGRTATRRTTILAMPFRPSPVLVRRLAVAASIVVIAVAGILAWPAGTTYSVGAGESPETLSLADGTVVRLAPGSTLRHRDSFLTAEVRSVRLEGEAFFEVSPAEAHDGHAFEVVTFNSRVEVVGTAFNVRAYALDSGATRVAVLHGSVKVASIGEPGESVLLSPGQGTLVEDDGRPAPPEVVSLERETSWITGGLAFDNAPMGLVFDEIARRFGVEIDAPPAIRRIRVSYWRESSIEVNEMLADLADLVNAHVRRTANGFDVYQADR